MSDENNSGSLIRYPRLSRVHDTIHRCQRLSKKSNEPQCISLEGRAGAGKTTLVKAHADLYPRRETDEGTEIPVFYMLTPSPVTVKGMAETMLERLGDPAAHRGSQPSLNSRLCKLIVDCKVELVILDDFHHLIDTKTNRILRTVSDWLKVLIKETQVPFLVVGIEGQVQQILKENEQLSRLFAEQVTLSPFEWNVADPEQTSIMEFTNFILFAEKMIGTTLPTELPRAELLYRMHYATDGVVANIMNLMRYAEEVLQEEKRSQMKMTDLSKAFERRLSKHLPKKVDPFKCEDETFTPPPPQEDTEEK
jgi:energy-coupling factor transporter ATP-binding protein EcfA2